MTTDGGCARAMETRPIFLWLWTFCLLSISASAEEFRILHPGDKYTVMRGDRLFTELELARYRKPVLYPIIGPGGIPMTRNHPMKQDIPGEADDHPHHKSLWFAHGDVNGVSFWHEKGSIEVDPAKPVIVKQAADGKPCSISFHTLWKAPGGRIVCTDDTTISFVEVSGGLAIDWDTTVHASHGELTFGDTKEGTMAIRTHPSLRLENEPDRGVATANGRAVNSEGLTGRGIWGKRAAWVDYSGNVGGEHVGIAIFDHPGNLRHPTNWHARHYGLVAANPFGKRHFEGSGDGSFHLPAGDSLRFRYRFVFHRGTAKEAGITSLYQSYGAK